MMLFRPLNTLATRLVAALLAVTLAIVALSSVLIERSTMSDFETYLANRQAMERGAGPPANRPGPGPLVGGLEDAFLDHVRDSLLLSGGISAAAAAVLALLLAYQITRPVRSLVAAAASLSRGNLDTRVQAPGSDELGRLGQAFNAMASSLQEQEAQRRALMSDIAHELRTPITVLQGNLEAMQDGVLEPTPEQLAILQEETHVLTRLIDDLRTLSLFDAGRLTLDLQPADVAELAARVTQEMSALAVERGVALKLRPPAGPVLVTLDAARIAQVLRNLIDNALRYTPASGSVDVVVGHEGDELRVSVIDTGSGIPPEHLPHVFERFYRADPSRARASGGSGLGLAIVRQIVEAHHGRVWAESEIGRGSAFHFALPLHRRVGITRTTASAWTTSMPR